MTINYLDNRLFRGVLQSKDGVITKIFDATNEEIVFQAAFKINNEFLDKFRQTPDNIIFSERSRIARLGVQIMPEQLSLESLTANCINLKMTAVSVISGYPALKLFESFFSPGFQVGRLVYCDPEALLSSEEVINAIENSELKLPASTTISSNGDILISPHKLVCELKRPLDNKILDRILMYEDGREVLNRYQISKEAYSVTIPPKEGIITTCSMYLNEHYIVLQSSLALGRHLPATILDPIKTRGVQIYLEIVNEGNQPIVNPLIPAKVYRAKRLPSKTKTRKSNTKDAAHLYEYMRKLEKKFDENKQSTCNFLTRPVAIINEELNCIDSIEILTNGPKVNCEKTKVECLHDWRDLTPESSCPHKYATSKIKRISKNIGKAIVLKYFPNLIEHRDIINLVSKNRLNTIYFFEPSYEHGPFLSQSDHSRLKEYHAFQVDVHWVSKLTNSILTHKLRDGKGFFVLPERLIDFHNSMLFAFYGSNIELSQKGADRLEKLLDALIEFWGKHIGILTGGGSGVMEVANSFAKKRGIFSGANFLDITDQTLTTNVDFCQVFQDTCRHSRQKWFEIASFPIFHVGGLGSLEELGITLCNMKLAVLDPVPIILFDTEGDGNYWSNVLKQIYEMVQIGRAPKWIKDKLVMTNDPKVVIESYRTHLQLF